MQETPYKCECGGRLFFYDIGFDDGYQCEKCKKIYEFHELVEQLQKEKEGSQWVNHLHTLMN